MARYWDSKIREAQHIGVKEVENGARTQTLKPIVLLAFVA
jgi:hypothetical protein